MSCKPVSKERALEAQKILWGESPETETLDKLYLEWSQFTQAKTAREIQLQARLDAVRNHAYAGTSLSWRMQRIKKALGENKESDT